MIGKICYIKRNGYKENELLSVHFMNIIKGNYYVITEETDWYVNLSGNSVLKDSFNKSVEQGNIIIL